MTFRWLIVAQSPSAYILSHPSTRSHSSVAKARLLPWKLQEKILDRVDKAQLLGNEEHYNVQAHIMKHLITHLTNLFHKIFDHRTSSNTS